jgi:hypothetical protein
MKYGLAILLLLNSMNTYAALNKWVDAEGKVHYSDTAPPEVNAKTLRNFDASRAATTPNDAPPQKSIAERESDWKKSQKSKDDAIKKVEQEKEEATIKQKNCESARGNLAIYENSPRIVNYNEKGEPVYLSDEARKHNTEDARNSVSKYCN